MKELFPLRGIVTVLNTPFTEEDTIDVPGLRANCHAALGAGVVGFLVPAYASEVLRLSEEERELLVRTVLDMAAGKAMVIGGATADTPQARSRIAARLIDMGCDGVLASIPYECEKQYCRDAEALAALNPPCLMLQDWDPSGPGIPLPVIKRLFDELEPFRCLKVEVVPAGPKYSALREVTDGRLHLSGGWAVMGMIEALDRGVHAFMPTGLHAAYTRIIRLYDAGNREAARELHRCLMPVLAFSNQHLDISIHFFKRLLFRQGVYATPRVRTPIMPFDAIHERMTEELIGYAMDLLKDSGAINPSMRSHM